MTRYIFFLARVPLAVAEEGSEMERLEKSGIALFAGLSLISSPDNRAGKKGLQNTPCILLSWKIQGGREVGGRGIEKGKELTESIRAGLRGLALDPDDDGLLPRRGLRGGRIAAGGRRHGPWQSVGHRSCTVVAAIVR